MSIEGATLRRARTAVVATLLLALLGLTAHAFAAEGGKRCQVPKVPGTLRYLAPGQQVARVMWWRSCDED
jgi:hypothetical protein